MTRAANLDRLRQLTLAKYEEARRRGMTDDETDAWVGGQLKDEFKEAFADPMFKANLVIAFAALPDEPSDDEWAKQQRAAARRVVNDARKAIARESRTIERRLRQ